MRPKPDIRTKYYQVRILLFKPILTAEILGRKHDHIERVETFANHPSLIHHVYFSSLSKIMKCAANDDIVTIRAEDNADAMNLIFESPSMSTTSIHIDLLAPENHNCIRTNTCCCMWLAHLNWRYSTKCPTFLPAPDWIHANDGHPFLFSFIKKRN